MSQLSKQMALEATKPRKIAIYAHLTTKDQIIVAEVFYNNRDEHWQLLPKGQEREIPQYNHVRISEVLEVVCRPVEEDTIVQNAVTSLDKQMADLTAEYYEAAGKIKGMKKQLLALTYEPEVPPEHPLAEPPSPEVEPPSIVHVFACNSAVCQGECATALIEELSTPQTVQPREFDDHIPF
jgi:hypothetical protein